MTSLLRFVGIVTAFGLFAVDTSHAQGRDKIRETPVGGSTYFLPSSLVGLPQGKIQYEVMVVFAKPLEVGNGTFAGAVERITGTCTGTVVYYETRNFVTQDGRVESVEGNGKYVLEAGSIQSDTHEVACAYFSGGNAGKERVLDRIRREADSKTRIEAMARVPTESALVSAGPKPALSSTVATPSPPETSVRAEPAIAISREAVTYPILVDGIRTSARALPFKSTAFDSTSFKGGIKGYSTDFLVDGSALNSKSTIEIEIVPGQVRKLLFTVAHPDTRLSLVRLVDAQWHPASIASISAAEAGDELFLAQAAKRGKAHRVRKILAEDSGTFIELNPPLSQDTQSVVPLFDASGNIKAVTRAKSGNRPQFGQAIAIQTISFMDQLGAIVQFTGIADSGYTEMPPSAKALISDADRLTRWLIAGNSVEGQRPLAYALASMKFDFSAKGWSGEQFMAGLGRVVDAYLSTTDEKWRATPPKKSNYELEALAFAEASKSLPTTASPEAKASFDRYWQRRLDVADRVDKGQVSRDAARSLVDAYHKQFLAELQNISDTNQREIARLEALQAQRAAQAQAQADALRVQERQQMLEAGLKLLFPPPPPPPPRPLICNSWANGRYIQTTCQ